MILCGLYSEKSCERGCVVEVGKRDELMAVIGWLIWVQKVRVILGLSVSKPGLTRKSLPLQCVVFVIFVIFFQLYESN